MGDLKFFNIYYADLSYNNSSDHKDRPVIIIEINNNKNKVDCLKVTDSSHKQNYNDYYLIKDWKQAGLSKESIIDLTDIYKIEQTEIRRWIGKLSFEDMNNLLGKLGAAKIESLLEAAANSNGIYSLTRGWLKEPVRDKIPDNIDLEPGLTEWKEKADKCKTIEDIDDYIDNLYKLRQEGLLKDGEYSKENLIFKEIRNLGILQTLKDQKTELENKEMSLEESINYRSDIYTEQEANKLIELGFTPRRGNEVNWGYEFVADDGEKIDFVIHKNFKSILNKNANEHWSITYIGKRIFNKWFNSFNDLIKYINDD